MSGCSINRKENQQYKELYEGLFGEYNTRYVWEKNGELPLNKTRIGGEVVDSQLYNDILKSEYANNNVNEALRIMARTFSTDFQSQYLPNEDGQYTIDQVTDFISNEVAKKNRLREKKLAEINTPSSYTINFPEATLGGKPTGVFFTREEGLQIFKTFEFFGANLNNWTKVKEALEEVAKELKLNLQEGNGRQGDESRLVNLFVILENFDMFKDWYATQQDKVSIEVEDPEIQDSVTALTKDKDVSQQKRATKKVVKLVASLPAYREVYPNEINPETNEPYKRGTRVLVVNDVLGLPMSGNFASNWNILTNNLSGIQKYEDMYNKIKDLAESRPEFKLLVEQLVDPTQALGTIDGGKFVTAMAFRSIMSNPDIKHFVVNQQRKDSLAIVTVQQKGRRNLRNPIATYDRTYFAYQDEKYVTTDTDGIKHVNLDRIVQDFEPLFRDLGQFLSPGAKKYLESIRMSETAEEKDNKLFFTNSRVDAMNQFVKSIGLGLTNGEFELPSNREKVREFYSQENVAKGLKAIFEKLKIVNGLNKLSAEGETIRVENILDFIFNPVKEILGDVNKVPEEVLEKVGLLGEQGYIGWAKGTTDEQIKRRDNNTKNYLGKKETELAPLLEFFDSFETEFNSGSYLTAENKKKFSRNSWFYLTQTTSAVNNANNYEELINTPGFERFDYRKNPDIIGSIWLNRIFGLPLNRQEIEKNPLSSYKKQRTTSGVKAGLDIIDFGGMEVKSQLGNKGFHTTNLHPDAKVMQDVFSFFQTGFMENIRFGDKTSSFAVMFTDPMISNKVYIPFNYDMIANPVQDLAVENELVSIFTNYLGSEVKRIQTILEEGNSVPKSTYQEAGKRLFIFKEILPAEIYYKITKANNLDDLIRAFGEAKLALPEGLKTYFDKQTDRLVERIVEVYTHDVNLETGNPLPFNIRLASTANILNAHNFVNPQLLPAEVRKEIREKKNNKIDINVDSLRYLASYYIKNGFIHNVEFLKFFVGDIANFDKTLDKVDDANDNFRELFKRISFTSTPGNPPVWSPIVEAFFENDVNRDALSVEISGIERKFTDKVRTVIYEDVKTFTKEDWGKYIDAYYDKGWEELGINETDFEAYVDNPKEADGQGVVTLDFYRNYLISIGRWDWDIQEAAFNQQVTLVKKINEYNRTGNPELAKEISQLQTNMSAPFPPLKLGYFGPIVEDVKRNGLHKFSLVPLIPSAIQGTQMMEQLNLMYNNQIDYYTFKSGSKMGNFGEAAKFYVERKINGENVLVPNPEIGEQNITTLFLQNLREQQYQAPKFKGESTLATQMIKLLFGDFFEFGDVNSSLSESTQDKIPGLYEKFSKRIKNIVAFEQLKLERKLGIKRNAAGTIVSVDQMQMARYLTSELDKKDGSELLRKYIQVDADGNFINPLDAINQRDKIEQVILSVINNKIIKQKLNGESYIQVAGTGFETKRFSKPTAQQLKDYGAAGLKFYEVDEDGNNQPMEVKIGFNPKKHSGLLQLKFNGVKIETLAKLNDILKGDTPAKKDWIKANKEKITMVGVRIPVQGPQSMEYVQVKEFLPSSAGPIMILPAQIVTKSGGDYDIDKLTFFETALDEDGNIVTSDATMATYEESLNNQKELKLRKNRLVSLRNAIQKELSANPSYQEREVLRKEIKDMFASIEEAIANVDEYLDNPFVPEVYGVTTREELLNIFEEERQGIFVKVYELSSFDAANNLDKQIGFLRELGKEIRKITTESKELSGILNYKKVLTNELVDVIREMMTLPEWFGKSTAPNNNDIMEEYTPPSSKLSSTDVFNPLTSWQIYSENILAKDALGIDAKINTMQKEFQLAGLRYTSPFLNAYYFKANRNKNREILLGGTTDADGNHKISKVLSEFINGHVDIAKEDWIILLGLDEETSPLAHTMILAGTPVKDVLDFIKSDIIVTLRKLSNKSELFNDQYLNNPAGKSFVFKPKGAILKLVYAKLRQSKNPSIISLKETVEKIIAEESLKKKGKVSDAFKLSTYVNVLLKSNDFSKYIENFKPDQKLNEQDKLIRDIAYMLQFGVIQRQQERLRELTSNADFNTDNIRTSYTSSIREKKKSELLQDFNEDAINFMFKYSALSGFNSNGFTQEIMQTVFPITDSDTVNNAIGVYLKKYEIFKDDDVFKAVTRFKNNLIFGLAQLTASNENGKLLDYYRGQNGLFVRSNPNNMKVRFEQLIKDFPHLRNNYLFRNLYVADPNTSNYGNAAADSSREITFKIKNIDTDESDIEYNNAFEEGLNHENPVIREFFRDLALGSFMQFGPHFESGSLATIVPPSVYIQYTTEAYNKLEEMSKDEMVFDNYLSLTRFNTEFTRIFNSVFSLSPSFVKANYPELTRLNPWVKDTINAAVTLENKVLVYSELGDKTQSENIVIKPWNELKDATKAISNFNNQVISTRIVGSNEHFGNPYSSEKKVLAKNPSLIKTNSTKESVQRYIDWVLNSPEPRAAWIRERLKSGELKGKPILYYTELGEPSHATALDYLINKYDWTAAITTTQPTISGEVKLGVAELFESNPELAKIGTPAQYSAYLDTIFPNSKEKDIYQHSSNIDLQKVGFEKGFGKTSDAFFFDKFGASEYSGKYNVKVLLDINNTYANYNLSYVTFMDSKYGANTVENIRKGLELEERGYVDNISNKEAKREYLSLIEIEDPNNDSSQFIKRKRIEELQKYGNFDSIDAQGYLAVFEPEQIHILGNQQDIKRFKDFVSQSEDLNDLEEQLSISTELPGMDKPEDVKSNYVAPEPPIQLKLDLGLSKETACDV
jgi:hypothetical protein